MCRFFLNGFPVLFNLFVLCFLVTLCFVVAVKSFAWSEFQFKKMQSNLYHFLGRAVDLTFLHLNPYCNSLLTPTKCVPLLDQIEQTAPLLAMNLWNVKMKECTFKKLVTSVCTTWLEKIYYTILCEWSYSIVSFLC